MKMTNFEMVNMIVFLDRFADKKFPQRVSYALTKNAILLEKENQCYTIELNKLFDRYDDKTVIDENGNKKINSMGIPVIEAEYSKEFDEELSELLNMIVDIDIYTIDESLFDYDDQNGKYDVLSSAEMFQLQKYFCHSGSDEEKL